MISENFFFAPNDSLQHQTCSPSGLIAELVVHRTGLMHRLYNTQRPMGTRNFERVFLETDFFEFARCRYRGIESQLFLSDSADVFPCKHTGICRSVEKQNFTAGLVRIFLRTKSTNPVHFHGFSLVKREKSQFFVPGHTWSEILTTPF